MYACLLTLAKRSYEVIRVLPTSGHDRLANKLNETINNLVNGGRLTIHAIQNDNGDTCISLREIVSGLTAYLQAERASRRYVSLLAGCLITLYRMYMQNFMQGLTPNDIYDTFCRHLLMKWRRHSVRP